jgi:hypothetical protein
LNDRDVDVKREKPGIYEVTTTSGERVEAFIPAPLPPSPPLALDGNLQQGLERAVLAVGRATEAPGGPKSRSIAGGIAQAKTTRFLPARLPS